MLASCWLQVASSFLIELGNGDKFLFDLGSGSYANLIATGNYKVNKVCAPVGVCTFSMLPMQCLVRTISRSPILSAYSSLRSSSLGFVT